MAQVYGNADKSVSEYLKAWIKAGDIWVVGLIGPGTSRQLQSNWTSPFEQSAVGSMFDKIGAVIQSQTLIPGMSERTSISSFNSTQIWDGNRPHSFNLVLSFYALADPLKEVEMACSELEKMASPDLNSYLPGGRIPNTVTLNIGRRRVIPDCVIESISTPLDKEVGKDGYLLRTEVNLTICTKTTLSKDKIAGTWGV